MNPTPEIWIFKFFSQLFWRSSFKDIFVSLYLSYTLYLLVSGQIR